PHPGGHAHGCAQGVPAARVALRPLRARRRDPRRLRSRGAGHVRQRTARGAPPEGASTRWHPGGCQTGVTRLRRADCAGPGFRRRRQGRGFVYLDENGTRISDASLLERLRGLVIPPAWKDVWICPWPNGHLQAVGIDARGRRQYRYHDRWRARRDAEKFDRMAAFALCLPKVRRRCAALLAGDEPSRERVLACAIRLL